jgi:hypothetical protein
MGDKVRQQWTANRIQQLRKLIAGKPTPLPYGEIERLSLRLNCSVSVIKRGLDHIRHPEKDRMRKQEQYSGTKRREQYLAAKRRAAQDRVYSVLSMVKTGETRFSGPFFVPKEFRPQDDS